MLVPQSSISGIQALLLFLGKNYQEAPIHQKCLRPDSAALAVVLDSVIVSVLTGKWGEGDLKFDFMKSEVTLLYICSRELETRLHCILYSLVINKKNLEQRLLWVICGGVLGPIRCEAIF